MKSGEALPPLNMDRNARARDESGTPIGLIDAVQRASDLTALDTVDPANVLVEFPFGKVWRDQSGYSRFVRLREPHRGCHYAFVRTPL